MASRGVPRERNQVIRRPSAAIVLVALLTVGCHATKGAAVLSLEKAADVAVIHVADPASPNQPLVLFMLPQPLPAGTIVDTNRPPSTDTGDLRLLLQQELGGLDATGLGPSDDFNQQRNLRLE